MQKTLELFVASSIVMGFYLVVAKAEINANNLKYAFAFFVLAGVLLVVMKYGYPDSKLVKSLTRFFK